MPERSSVELALIELDVLLQLDDAPEAAFQSWFERHDVVFEAYGFTRRIPHPRLELGAEIYIPDFIAEKPDGLWEVVELKCPDTKVLKNAERRQTFYASLEQCYAQCREYSDALRAPEVRESIRNKHGCDIQQDVVCVLIAGRRDEVDLRRVHSIMIDRRAMVTLQTFDDVRNQLDHYRARLFSKQEALPGFGTHMMVTLQRVPDRNNFIVDYGVELDRNRMSIYVDPDDHLCFRIIDNVGSSHMVRVGLARAQIRYGQPSYLVFEFGLAEECSFLSVEVNGVFQVDRRLDSIDLRLDYVEHAVLGSDVLGREHTDTAFGDIVGIKHTSDFRKRCQMREYMFHKYFFNADTAPEPVHFTGNQHRASTEHPNFTRQRNGV